jgi:deoxyribonuclease V
MFSTEPAETRGSSLVGPFEWRPPHSIREARALQESLRHRVTAEGSPRAIRFVAGLDAHYQTDAGLAWGAAAVLAWPSLELVESALACRPLDFPYVPGLLSFREAPALLAALACLSRRPDLLFVDGHGIAHPRRFGLASHVGVLADLPTIGVAKSRLIGRFAPPSQEKGASSPLTDADEVIGAVLRTRARVRPVFVSVGHRIGLQAALALALQATSRYRIPEPIRLADRLSRMHDR